MTVSIKKPIISEKSVRMAEQGKYVFKVDRSLNKSELKKLFASLYGVEVIKVNLLNLHEKKRRAGRGEMVKRKKMRKAIITLKKGQMLDQVSGNEKKAAKKALPAGKTKPAAKKVGRESKGKGLLSKKDKSKDNIKQKTG